MESRKRFGPPPRPLTPDQAIVQNDAETMERELIFGMVKSCRFYRYARNIICEYNPEKRTHRQDFTIGRYNVLFRALDGWYRRFDSRPLDADMRVPPNLLSAYIIDWGNKNKVDMAMVLALAEEIKDETALLAEITPESSMALIESPGFKHWLESRIIDFAASKIANQKTLGILTLDNLEEILKNSNQVRHRGQTDSFVNAGSLLRSTRKFGLAMKSGLADLDRAIGGGFRQGTGSLIAGINGGGKTVLMMQLAKNFASSFRVAVFTTERPPHSLVTALVSSHLSIQIQDFYNRPELQQAESGAETEFSMLPAWLWTDPRTASKLLELEQIITSNILFVDWARGQGYSIEKHLDAEVEKMVDLGWNPDAILFDWIGGGLEQISDKNLMRHVYQAGIDHLVNNQAKRHNRVVVAAAQLDKVKVKANLKYVEMHMLAECKSMTNLVANFIGLTALRDTEESGRLHKKQFMSVDKATLGPKGNVPVEQCFELQKFIGASKLHQK